VAPDPGCDVRQRPQPAHHSINTFRTESVACGLTWEVRFAPLGCRPRERRAPPVVVKVRPFADATFPGVRERTNRAPVPC
jgi:hypothetical protein